MTISLLDKASLDRERVPKQAAFFDRHLLQDFLCVIGSSEYRSEQSMSEKRDYYYFLQGLHLISGRLTEQKKSRVFDRHLLQDFLCHRELQNRPTGTHAQKVSPPLPSVAFGSPTTPRLAPDAM